MTPSELEYKSFLEYINNGENGMVHSKTLNGVELTLKYLPSNYLAYRDLSLLSSPSKQQEDSLMQRYQNSMTFVLNLSPENMKGVGGFENGVLSKDISGIEEYKSRALSLNFAMTEMVKLRSEKGVIKPSLTNMENTYDLAADKSIYIVFSRELVKTELGTEDLEFVFEDGVFDTGISVFSIDAEVLKNIPSIKHDLISPNVKGKL